MKIELYISTLEGDKDNLKEIKKQLIDMVNNNELKSVKDVNYDDVKCVINSITILKKK